MGAMTLSLLRLFAQRTPTSLEPITIISVRHEASLSKPKGSNVPVIYVLSVQPKHIRKQRALRRVRHTTGVQVLLKVGLLTTSDARSLLPLLNLSTQRETRCKLSHRGETYCDDTKTTYQRLMRSVSTPVSRESTTRSSWVGLLLRVL